MFVGLWGVDDPEVLTGRTRQVALNSGVNDPKLTDMILCSAGRSRWPRKQTVLPSSAPPEQALFGSNGSVKVVSAWDAHIKNFMPNNGFDFGGRMMAAWIDK
jgi:hypothetical protein